MKVVCLEAVHCIPPRFDFDHEYIEYQTTSPSQVLDRVYDATIIITTLVPIVPAIIDQCPNLKLIAVFATGVGWADKDFLVVRGITLMNCPQSNIPAVSEHAIGLYFAVRKKIVELHNRTVSSDEWAEQSTLTKRWELGPPPSCNQEKVAIIGFGALGKRIHRLCQGIGMGDVVIVERKGTHPSLHRPERIAFEEAIQVATVLILCCPKDSTTIDLIDEKALRSMRKDAILINMARGGIVNEAALAKALHEKWIAGAATDVLEQEPGIRGATPLLPISGNDVPNLTISPHVSWFSKNTILALQRLMKDGIESWVAGRPINIVIDGRQMKEETNIESTAISTFRPSTLQRIQDSAAKLIAVQEARAGSSSEVSLR